MKENEHMRNLIKMLLLFALIIFAGQQIDAKRIDIDEKTFFVGNSYIHNGVLYHSGVRYNSDLTKIIGLFDKDFNVLQVFSMMPDSTRVNYDTYTNGMAATTIFLPGRRYEEHINGYLQRRYDFDRKLWLTGNFAYNNEDEYPVDEVTTFEDRLFTPVLKYLCMPGLMLLFVYMSLGLIPSRKFKLKFRPIIMWTMVVLLAAVCIFADENIICGIFLPVLVFLLLWWMAVLLKNARLRLVFRTFACAVCVGLLAYQYLGEDERVRLTDGSEVQFRWQRGTDLIKRAVIRNIVRNLIAIPGTEQYLSQYELRNYEFRIIAGEWLGWLSMLYPNEVKDDLSCKDALIVLKKICKISGNKKFIMPDANTWKKASNQADKLIFRKLDEQQKSGSGRPNHLGLYDLEGSVREWTSTPGSGFRTIESGIRLPVDSYAVIAGGTYSNNDFGLRNFHKSMDVLCGLRIAYGTADKLDYMLVIGGVSAKQNGVGEMALLKKVDDTDLSEMDRGDVQDYLISKSGESRTYHIVRVDSLGNSRSEEIRVAANSEPFDFFWWPHVHVARK